MAECGGLVGPVELSHNGLECTLAVRVDSEWGGDGYGVEALQNG